MKKELLETFKYDEKGNLLEIPTVEKLENSKYTQAVLREVLRVAPIVPGVVATASKVKA